MTGSQGVYVILRYCLVVCGVMGQQAVYAQDTINWLPPAEITVDRFSPYGSQWDADSTEVGWYAGQGLGNLLRVSSGLMVQAYSPGGLITPAGRGGSSRHTAVNWNGVNLQSPLNGTLDLSLFPLEFLESAGYTPGGLSTMVGSGSLGGTLHLRSGPGTTNGWRLGGGYTGGSFGLHRPFAQIQYGDKKYQGRLRGLWSQSRNDFRIEGEERQSNSARQEWALSQENTITLNDRNRIRTYLWLQGANRQLPPSTISANRNEYQLDSIVRTGVEWEHFGNRRVDRLRFFYLGESTVYGSDLVLPANNRARSWVGQYEHEQPVFALWRLGYGAQWRRDAISGDNLSESVRQLFDLFVSAKRTAKGYPLIVDLGMRLPTADGQFYWPAGHAGVKYLLGRYGSVRATASYNFSLPGGNDLYWTDGQARGNPDLLPERSVEQEVAASFFKKSADRRYELQLRLYHRRVNNWILWSAQAGSTIFFPENLRSVRAYGAEIQANAVFRAGIHQWGMEFFGSLGNTVLLDNPTNRAVEGNQLPHQPPLLGQGTIWWQWRSFRMTWHQQVLGARYDGLANLTSERLSARAIGQLELSAQFTTGSVRWQCFARIHNLWNNYVVQFRYFPVPGRHLRIGVYAAWGSD